jgi:similar to stage IV sporulation protein
VLILKLRSFFFGYLRVVVHGAYTEKFLNLAIACHIPLWELARADGRAVFCVDLDSFFELRHLARRTGCRLRIERKAGLPFFCNRLLRRRGMVAGLAFFLVSLYVLSSFVLFITVEGNEKLETDYILKLAGEAGAYRGLLKERLDPDAVANRMLIAEPKLEWVGLQLEGTRLIIEVVEAKQPELEPQGPANLVAAKDGLVTDVLVIMGEARVKPGDTVRRGQVLIEGVLRPETPWGEPSAGKEPIPVRARGEVIARVWYEGYGEASLIDTIRVRTGKRISSWTLLVDGQPVLKVGRSTVSYRDYDREIVSTRLLERILRFPVELVTETCYEVYLEKREISRDEAFALAARRAKTLAELQLPAGETVEAEQLTESETGSPDTVAVRCILETSENIAVPEFKNNGGEN